MSDRTSSRQGLAPATNFPPVHKPSSAAHLRTGQRGRTLHGRAAMFEVALAPNSLAAVQQ